MIGVGEFTAYWSDVPVIGTNFGEPSYVAVKWAALRLTVAVCGMLLAITASCACAVPGIDASTRPAGLRSGIFAKSGGSWRPGTYSHGPSVERAEPPARDENVRELRLQLEEQMRLVVGRIQEFGPGDRAPRGRATRLDQLGRHRADVDDVRSRLTGWRVEEIHLAGLHRGLARRFERGGRRGGGPPRGVEGGGFQEAPAREEIVRAARRIEQDQRRRVDHTEQWRTLDLPETRHAVDSHEQGRNGAHDDARRIVLDRLR